MKTLEQVRQEKVYGDVFKTDEFIEDVREGIFISDDGNGHPHNGDRELFEIDVWDLSYSELIKYPYFCWYNR